MVAKELAAKLLELAKEHPNAQVRLITPNNDLSCCSYSIPYNVYYDEYMTVWGGYEPETFYDEDELHEIYPDKEFKPQGYIVIDAD